MPPGTRSDYYTTLSVFTTDIDIETRNKETDSYEPSQ